MAQRSVFSQKLKQYRQARDLTQIELANLAGYAVSTIRKLESGVLRPSRQLAEHFAQVLGLDASTSATFVALAGLVVVNHAMQASNNNAAAISVLQPRTAFPSPFTPLIGRDQELRELETLLMDSSSRLITLLGPGGSGKTRLAIEIARTLDPLFRDGAVFVSLAALHDSTAILFAVASALRMSIQGGDDPRVQLLDYLSAKQMLLILDNYEHLLPETGLLADMLDHAPAAKILITSREHTALPSEMIYDLGGLAYPVGVSNQNPTTFGAIQLFVQRARQADRRFALTPDITAAVTHICTLVEGLPLAIELVAGAVREHNCITIASNIQQMVWELSPGWQDAPNRHRNLHAVFDYSWLLLDELEQNTTRQLSVFRSAFDHSSAREVADVSADLLDQLVSKSMLRRYEDGSYGMHELTRQYAAKRLAEVGVLFTHVHDRHCQYFAERLAPNNRSSMVGSEEDTLRFLRTKIGDVRAAWKWAVRHDNTKAIDQLIDGVFHVYETLGFFREGEQLFRLAREGVEARAQQGGLSVEHRRTLANVMARQAALLCRLDQYPVAQSLLEQSLAMLQEQGKPIDQAFVQLQLGRVAWATSNYHDALRHYQNCRELAHALGEHVLEAQSLIYTGAIEDVRGNFSEARKCYEHSLVLFQGLDYTWGCAYALQRLGIVAECEGHYEDAQHYYTQSLTLRQALDDQWGIAQSVCGLGNIAKAYRRYDEAKRLFDESLVRFEHIGDSWGVALCYTRLAEISCRIGLFVEAHVQADKSYGMFQVINDRWGIAYVSRVMGSVSIGLDLYDDAEKYFLQALLIARTIGLVPRMLDILLGLAYIRVKVGDAAGANKLLLVIIEHSASWAETRSEALSLMQAELTKTVGDSPSWSLLPKPAQQLDEVVAQLLGDNAYPQE